MTSSPDATFGTTPALPARPKSMGRRIAAGLVLGIVCGLLFGEYCRALSAIGQVYVGLLQMTVLPYLVLSLVTKIGRLEWRQVRELGGTALAVLLGFWVIGIILIVLVSNILPPLPGASFYSASHQGQGAGPQEFLSTFIPANVFRALSEEYVPAIVIFCVFFGAALGGAPGKQPLLDYLELCASVVGRINTILVGMAPIGLFALTAAAAGTLRLDELARLQAYLIVFGLACSAAFFILPLLLSNLTDLRYREIIRAAREPVLIAIATGKLLVVLPEIAHQCEKLLRKQGNSNDDDGASTAGAVVPLAYPFPHLGKILSFTFVSFAAWYAGRGLTLGQTTSMATAGAVSSFASPLVAIPPLLDQYQLPQDLMAFFILPGFLTMRMADVVGVMHLLVLSVLVARILQRRIQVQWWRLAATSVAILLGLGTAGAAARWYLVSTTLEYDLDKRLLSLEVPGPHKDTVVYKTRDEAPAIAPPSGTTLERIRSSRVIRVGYHPDHFPYSFFNQQGHLVGLDIELMHRLAARLKLRLVFVPLAPEKLAEQLESGEIDVAVGGLVMLPERLLRVGFTEAYDTATIAIIEPDYRREKFATWDGLRGAGVRIGVVDEEPADAARRALPGVEIVQIDSNAAYFKGERKDLDGLIMSAESGAAWTVLYPEYTATVPKPLIRRPVGMAVRRHDADWVHFLDRWLEFERLDGALDQLRAYWVEGGGVQRRAPRWCVLRDVLHWLP